MGVTEEAAQMDLDFYFGNFDLKSIFLRRTRSEKKHNVSRKHIDLSISSRPIVLLLEFMESQKKHNTKLKPNDSNVASAISSY